MSEKRRTKKLAILGTAALIMALAAVAPAFAWTVNTCVATTWSSSCATNPSFPTGSTVPDIAKLSGEAGTITFSVASGVCSDYGTLTQVSSQSVSSGQTYASTTWSSGSSPAGSYVWIVHYFGSSDPTGAKECEPFTLFKAPPTAPEFPLGMALLLALTIPGLLLIRSKFSPSTITH